MESKRGSASKLQVVDTVYRWSRLCGALLEHGVCARERRRLENGVVNQCTNALVSGDGGKLRRCAVGTKYNGEDSSKNQSCQQDADAHHAGQDVGLANNRSASRAVIVAANVGALWSGGIALLTLIELAIAALAALALRVAARELRRNGIVALLAGVNLAVTALATSAGLGAAVLECRHCPIALLTIIELAVTALAVSILRVERALLRGVASVALSIGGISRSSTGSADWQSSIAALAGSRGAHARSKASSRGLASDGARVNTLATDAALRGAGVSVVA